MKVLIWIGCFIVATILNTLLGYATGIKVGYLLFYLAVYFVAKKLCSMWDEHKENKAAEKNAPIQKPQVGFGYQGDTANNANISTASGWQCSCGRVHPKYETSCICGKSKFDNLKPNTDKICFCRKCGEKLIDNSRFCRKCGTEIVEG